MEDEINLRDLIEVLLRGKWIIALVTAAAVGASGILSWFVLTPVYQARVRLMVAFPARQQPAAIAPNGGLDEILRVLSAYPDLSLESYLQQIENPVLLQRVVEDLQLPMNRRQLEAAVDVQVLKDTNLIEIRVSDTTPERAARIANKLAELFTKQMSQVATVRYRNSVRTIESQMADQDRKLREALAQLQGFLGQARGVDELRAETDAKTRLLADYRTQQVQLDVEAQALEAGVRQLSADLSAQPPKLETRRVLADDPLLHQVVGSRTGDAAGAAGLELRSEEFNPVHTDLAQRLAQAEADLAVARARRAALEAAIARTAAELEGLRSELAGRQAEQDLLQQRVDTLKAGRQALAQKLEEARIAESSPLTETNVILVSPALVPLAPVAPQTTRNIVLAGVLGFMASTFFVFFLDFWRRTSPGAAGAPPDPGAFPEDASSAPRPADAALAIVSRPPGGTAFKE